MRQHFSGEDLLGGIFFRGDGCCFLVIFYVLCKDYRGQKRKKNI